MESSVDIHLIWLIGGAVLAALELVAPGMVIIFFGLAAILIGLLIMAGVSMSIPASILLWFILSLALVLIFRNLALKIFPSDSSYGLVEDDVDAIGAVVPVITDVADDHSNGRIEYGGTSWQARTRVGQIAAGEKARLLYRDNIQWIVEPVEKDN